MQDHGVSDLVMSAQLKKLKKLEGKLDLSSFQFTWCPGFPKTCVCESSMYCSRKYLLFRILVDDMHGPCFDSRAAEPKRLLHKVFTECVRAELHFEGVLHCNGPCSLTAVSAADCLVPCTRPCSFVHKKTVVSHCASVDI